MCMREDCNGVAGNRNFFSAAYSQAHKVGDTTTACNAEAQALLGGIGKVRATRVTGPVQLQRPSSRKKFGDGGRGWVFVIR